MANHDYYGYRHESVVLGILGELDGVLNVAICVVHGGPGRSYERQENEKLCRR